MSTTIALAEGLAGLASRVDNLSHLTAGAESRTLEDQEDRLAKLTLVAIVGGMDATNAKYRDAVKRGQAANDSIRDADKKNQNVAQVIAGVAKAPNGAGKIL